MNKNYMFYSEVLGGPSISWELRQGCRQDSYYRQLWAPCLRRGWQWVLRVMIYLEWLLYLQVSREKTLGTEIHEEFVITIRCKVGIHIGVSSRWNENYCHGVFPIMSRTIITILPDKGWQHPVKYNQDDVRLEMHETPTHPHTSIRTHPALFSSSPGCELRLFPKSVLIPAPECGLGLERCVVSLTEAQSQGRGCVLSASALGGHYFLRDGQVLPW